jgi:hypothetical protein
VGGAFSSGNSNMRGWPRSRRPCTSVSPRNEEQLDQLIHANWQITARELRTELNVGFSVLETMLAMLEYRKVCDRWVPRMLTQEHKDHPMQVCQDLLNHYKAEGDSSLDHIITSDKTWCHHYEPESKQQFMLAPFDFHLFRPMKDGLNGQHFPDNNAVITSARKWVAFAGADFYKRSMQALVHRWRKCIPNGGEYVEL